MCKNMARLDHELEDMDSDSQFDMESVIMPILKRKPHAVSRGYLEEVSSSLSPSLSMGHGFHIACFISSGTLTALITPSSSVQLGYGKQGQVFFTPSVLDLAIKHSARDIPSVSQFSHVFTYTSNSHHCPSVAASGQQLQHSQEGCLGSPGGGSGGSEGSTSSSERGQER